MKNVGVAAFAGKNFLTKVVSQVGKDVFVRAGINAFAIGGIASGLYGRFITQNFNPGGNFFGW